jgi:hypothetical protein
MSVTQKLLLLKLHRALVSNNLFLAANHVYQILLNNKIPIGLDKTILRIHLYSFFNIHIVDTYFPCN